MYLFMHACKDLCTEGYMHAYYSTDLEFRGKLVEIVHFFHHLSLVNETQVVCLCSNFLYPLRYLAVPKQRSLK